MPPPVLLRVKEPSKYMLQCSWVTGGRRLLSLSPLGHKICQSLGLDICLGDVGYVQLHELEGPLGDPPHGETFPDDFSKPYEVIIRIGWLSK
jgi:hypothetical protein